jgi:hypothetical protein
MDNGAVFPMFYLPPVEYFTRLNQHKPNILIEKDEHLINKPIATARISIRPMACWRLPCRW